MKKGLKIVVCFMLIMMLCACKKQSLTKEEFSNKLLKQKFSVMDITSHSNKKNIKNVIIANNSKYQLEYTIFSDETAAKKAFNTNKKNINVISDAKGANFSLKVSLVSSSAISNFSCIIISPVSQPSSI